MMEYYFLLISLFTWMHFCHTKQLNVLIITVDDLRPSIRAFGDTNAVTPNIDQLARGGIIFKNAFAQQALCAPSRNSFLTSRRPDTLHLYDFYSYWRDFAGNFTTLPQYFKENNYHTRSIGKIFHPGLSSNFTDDYPLSWSVPPWHPTTEIYKNAAVCPTSKGWSVNLICPVKISEQPQQTLPDIQSTKEAIEFIESRKNTDEPFLLAIGYHKPHVPFKFPQKFAGKFFSWMEELHPIENITLPAFVNYPPSLPTVAWNPWNDIRWREDIASLNISFPFGSFSENWIRKIRQGYFASVSYVDHLIGQLLSSLKSNNLHQSTIVVLLGDHGWSLGEHGEWSKYSNFDVSVRVPLIFRIPGLTYFTNKHNVNERPTFQVDDPVELLDVFPTLVDLAGLKPIPKCPKRSSGIVLCSEGESLLSTMRLAITERSERSRNEWDKYALSQYPRPGFYPTSSPNSDKPKLHQIQIMGYSVRTRRYRYTQWLPWNHTTFQADWDNVTATEFYDHHIDPNEDLNLSGRPGLENIETVLIDLLRRGFNYY